MVTSTRVLDLFAQFCEEEPSKAHTQGCQAAWEAWVRKAYPQEAEAVIVRANDPAGL